MAPRLLGFFPHPDDEAYAAGGTLAACVGRGVDVTLVCATRGEAGWVADPDLRIQARGAARAQRSQELARLRTEELEASCAAIGIPRLHWLDLPDGRLADVSEAVATSRLEELLRETRPDVIITLGRDGVYGHRDHIQCTAWMDAVVARAVDSRTPRLLHAVFPKGLLTSFMGRMQGARPQFLGGDRRDLGVDADDVDLRVVLGPRLRQTKRACIECHRSQLVDGDPDTFLFPGFTSAVLREEWFVSVAGPPIPSGATDPFDGLS